MRPIPWLSALPILLQSLQSTGSDKAIVLRAVRDVGNFVERQEMVYESDQVKLSRNSNFMCIPSWKVELGVFNGEYDDAKRDARAELEALVAAHPGGFGEVVAHRRSHDLRLYLGSSELAVDSSAGLAVKRLLESACEDEAWKPVKVARVSLNAKQVELAEISVQGVFNTVSTSPIAEACSLKDGGIWDCDAKSYGRALMQPRSDEASLGLGELRQAFDR